MQYDIALKELLRAPAHAFFQLLVGSAPREWLNVELPSVQMRIPDVLVGLTDGRVHHLELQSANDSEMPWRMLGYYQALHLKFPGRRVVQQVLYVGAPAMSLASGIDQESLKFRYQLVDARQLDPEPLLASPSREDNLLAILCATADARAIIRRIIEGWTGVTEDQRADLAMKLLVLSGLRRLDAVVRKEIKSMPITLDLMETNSVIREMVEEKVQQKVKEVLESAEQRAEQRGELRGELRGEQRGELRGEQRGELRGEVKVLRTLLQRRFGPLPDAAEQRLSSADTTTLEAWALRVLDEPTLEDVLR